MVKSGLNCPVRNRFLPIYPLFNKIEQLQQYNRKINISVNKIVSSMLTAIFYLLKVFIKSLATVQWVFSISGIMLTKPLSILGIENASKLVS